MFCDKTNVNILTSILLQSGITDAVVCPGSRNGVIVHNLHELTRTASPEHPFRIHAVTDERSAAFVALGISLAQDLRPVAVCVTSGSALLNTIPAVAEAFYRQIPLLVISADRPPQLIGQLDGQTPLWRPTQRPTRSPSPTPKPRSTGAATPLVRHVSP